MTKLELEARVKTLEIKLAESEEASKRIASERAVLQGQNIAAIMQRDELEREVIALRKVMILLTESARLPNPTARTWTAEIVDKRIVATFHDA